MQPSLRNTGSTTPLLPDTPSRAEVLKGMACLDISGNRRIPILMEMVAALSRATEPKQVLREFAEGFLKLQGPLGYVSLSTRGLQPGEYKITRLITGSNPKYRKASDPNGQKISIKALLRSGIRLRFVLTFPLIRHIDTSVSKTL